MILSRAFVKELDDDQAGENIIERPQSEYPNYITLAGLGQINWPGEYEKPVRWTWIEGRRIVGEKPD